MNDSLLTHCFAFQGGSASSNAPGVALIACLVIVGICTIVAGAKLQSTYKRGWLLIASGLLRTILVFPLGILVLMMIVAGAIEIAAAIRLRKHITNTVFLASAGVASMLFFPLAIITPPSVSPFEIMGGVSLIFGACSLAFGLTMRSSHNKTS